MRYGLIAIPLLATFVSRAFDIADKFKQNDYKVTLEWGETVRYNKPYVNYFHYVVFKYNRTCAALNLTYEYKIDFGNDLELIVQAYKFASNEYRVFPIRMEINFCHAVDKNILGAQSIISCGNFTSCPVRKGQRIRICNWTPDESQFPPFVPTGRYMLEFQALYQNIEIFVVRGYGTVSRSEV